MPNKKERKTRRTDREMAEIYTDLSEACKFFTLHFNILLNCFTYYLQINKQHKCIINLDISLSFLCFCLSRKKKQLNLTNCIGNIPGILAGFICAPFLLLLNGILLCDHLHSPQTVAFCCQENIDQFFSSKCENRKALNARIRKIY